MYLVYQPEGSDEPTRWKYFPRKLMSAEREMLERRTTRNFTEFTKDVMQGNSLCRRALLFMFLKRDHPGTKYEDVDYAWDELTLEYSKGELIAMREEAEEKAPEDRREEILAQLDREIADAYDDPEEEGKARPPIAD
ncbi:hypothetical protein [Streptomyces phaeochromogenes]|uniref:hypothetical protein n=1 Tax=Streptomyces phaeochromogenes TaxID=1923 RepID=UPI002DDAD923|nr:hypothetical protein [Streptomyces phaeochromogenes]WRZ31335.1 hypothetical protein OG931_28125 [Streptomyces phaeochromogenes]